VVQSTSGGNIATITTTSAHNLLPGNYVHIYNAGDSTYSAPLNGGVVKVLTVPSPTQFTVSASYAGQSMAVGDYSSYRGQLWLVQSMFQVRDQSWLQWLNQFLKGYFTVVATYAQGGTVSSVGVTLLPKIQAGPKAEYAFIQYCTNDINAGSSDPAHCLSNIKTIVAALEALDIVPIVCTPPAIGDPNAPSDPATAAKAAGLQAVLQGEQQLAKADSHIILVDTYSRTVTPGDPLGHYLPNYAPLDGVHMLTYGEVKLADSVSADLAKLLPVTDLLPATPADDATESPSGFNIVQNGFMTGTGGVFSSTPNNTITGTMPTGWTFAASGGTQNAPISFNVSGNGVHTGVTGTTLDISVDYPAAGQGFQIGSNGPGSNFGPRMVPGSWYRCGFELVGYDDLSNLNVNGTVWLRLADATQISVYFMASGGAQVENGTPVQLGSPLQYLSQPFLVPQAVSGGYLFINGLFSGSPGAQKFSIGRAMCRTVDNPYQ
jgi:lysophospholipase L1-like esterase